VLRFSKHNPGESEANDRVFVIAEILSLSLQNIMLNTLLGTKGQMEQAFIKGDRIPVTKILAGPCVVTQIKSEEKDGYWAVQLGFGEKRIKNTTKPLQGHLKGATKGKMAPRFLREVRLSKKPEFKVGDRVEISDVFSVGDKVAVTGVSKGKGFAGVVKRWGFKGGPRTHGQSDRPRSGGSIGQGTTPGRVWKGKKMPGRMGNLRRTIGGLQVTSIDSETGAIFVSGPVPGAYGSLLVIKKLASGKLDELVKETQKRVVEGKEEEEEGMVEGGSKEEKKEVPEEKAKQATGQEGEKDE